MPDKASKPSKPSKTQHRLIWMRPENPGRGPKPAYSRAEIADAAIAIADADGLDALTMRRVAGEIGAGTMSLYRYVRGKDELIELMIDRAVTDAGLTDVPVGEWRAHIRTYAATQRAMAHRHPWLIRAASGHPKLGPGTMRAFERMLSSLDGLGLDIDQMTGVLGAVDSFTTGFVQQELAESEERRRTGMTEQDWRNLVGPYVKQMFDTGKFPMMKRVVIEAEDYPDPDAVFAWQLDRVLDGVAAAIDAQRSAGTAPDSAPLGPPSPPSDYTRKLRSDPTWPDRTRRAWDQHR